MPKTKTAQAERQAPARRRGSPLTGDNGAAPGRLDVTAALAERMMDAAKPPAKRGKAAPVVERVVILKPQRTYMRVTVEGDTPIISHNFSAKARQEMIDKQNEKVAGVRGKKQTTRAPRDPKAAFLDSMYLDAEGRPAFPASAIKKAAVEACTFLDGVTHKRMRGSFFVLGDYLTITNAKPVMREDTVRVGTVSKVPDIRYRAEFPAGWRLAFDVLYAADVVSAEDVINVIDRAGFHVGIGDWRPQRDGASGMFHVVNAEVADQSALGRNGRRGSRR